MKAPEAFEEAFREYGGTLDLSDIPAELSDNHRGVVADYRGFSGLGIYFDFITNEAFNAVATTHCGHELIGVFQGLPTVLSAYFNTFLSDPETFRNLDAGDEAEFDLTRISELRSANANLYTAIAAPQNAHRSIVAQNLTSCALLFILFHERTHIEAGHLHLLNTNYGINVYEELPASPLSEEQCALRRALEIEADNGAAFTSLKMWRKYWDAQFGKDFGLRVDDCWATSISILFLILDRFAKQRGFAHATHPDALVRYVSVMSACRSFIADSGLPELDLSSKEDSPVTNTIRWWKKHRFMNDIAPFYDTTTDRNLIAEINQLWQSLEPFRELLDDFKSKRYQLLGM